MAYPMEMYECRDAKNLVTARIHTWPAYASQREP